MYADIGTLRVANVQAKTSTTEMRMNCDMMQRGDIVLPYSPRPAPLYHDVKFDPFARPVREENRDGREHEIFWHGHRARNDRVREPWATRKEFK
jgi:hypothetical protein